MMREAIPSNCFLDAGQRPDTAELVAVSAMPGMAGVICMADGPAHPEASVMVVGGAGSTPVTRRPSDDGFAN
jgi:hypothetical protein